MNAKNRNNTSSAFSLPSEFKASWEELVKVLILDAFPDFMDKFELLVPMAQEIFLLLINALNQQIKEKLITIAKTLNINDDENAINHLNIKIKPIFQEYWERWFGEINNNDEYYNSIIQDKYKPIWEKIISNYEDEEDYNEMLDEAINSEDFRNFIKSLHKIVMHLCLSDPPISVQLASFEERMKKDNLIEKYEFKRFKKQNMFCIDGFPKEDLPAVVVYPPPMKGRYVYQGIKPSVI